MIRTDEELVARATAGDVDSFNQLVSRWERTIYALAYRTLGREEDARAVVQEVIHGDACQVCKGQQRVMLVTTGEVIVCGHCKGVGVEPEPARQRSRRMGIHHSRFPAWSAPYRWAHSEVLAATIEASQQFRSALGRRAA